jgi:hypothetical protein
MKKTTTVALAAMMWVGALSAFAAQRPNVVIIYGDDVGYGEAAQVCREKVRCSSRWKSCPGKGRPGRVAILTDVEVTKRSKLGRQKAAKGRLQVGRS